MGDAGSEVWTLPGYEVGEVLGRGGFATVYRARQLSLGREVALKVLITDLATDGDRRRFDRERAVLAELSTHPYVVDVYDAGVAQRRPFVVMRLYRGGTLAARLADTGALPVDGVVDLVAKVASALDAAHVSGVVHRDLKPENILLTADGQPALADFGIAGMVDPERVRTHTSTTYFTLAHVAPEILEGGPYNVASDVYALASTTYQLLAGQPAFNIRDPRVASRILDEPPTPIDRPDLPEAVWAAVGRGLAKDPGQRQGSAGAFAAELVEALDGTGRILVAGAATERVEPCADAAVDNRRVSDEQAHGDGRGCGDQVAVLGGAGGEPSPDEQVTEVRTRIDLPEPENLPRPGNLPEPGSLPEPENLAGSEAVEKAAGSGLVEAAVPSAVSPSVQRSAGRRRAAVASLVVVGLFLAMAGAGYAWVKSQYAVGVKGNKVVIIQGIAAQVLGMNLESTTTTDVPVDLLPTPSANQVRQRIVVGGPSRADEVVTRLEQEAKACESSLRPPCPARPPAVPKVAAKASTYPHGDTVTITWTAPDPRDGVTTSLRVNDAGASGCPAVITSAGHCSFVGAWNTTYVVAAQASAPGQAPVDAASNVDTYQAPSLSVAPGKKYTDDGTEYCSVTVSATGLAPYKTYSVSFDSHARHRDGEAPDVSRLDASTDSRGNLKGAEFGWGYRDPGSVSWVSISLDNLTARRDPWGCP